ncbi:MAG TPA: hypothetical protein VHD63_14205 [Ktedonobacteraceae bacterium]|nr:hypothetical protein [Ktedonobacteraceae bacterium]
MNRLSALGGALRYEFLMQVRRRAIWVVLALVGLMSAILWLAFTAGGETTDLDAVMYLAQFTARFLPVGAGLVLADRLARDEKLRVNELLDTCPGSLGSRLFGKYIGCTLATLVPVVLLYTAGVADILVRFHHPYDLVLTLATFAAIPLPGILFAAGFSLALPALLKVPLYQVLFIGYWFWANLMSPRFQIPTLVATMLNATGPWAQEAFFNYPWVFLRLHPAVWQGVLSIALLIGLSLLAVCLAWLYLRWTKTHR